MATQTLDCGSGGVTGSERNDDNIATTQACLHGADNRRLGIVAPLDEDVRLQRLDQLDRGVFLEHDDGIDH